MLILAKDGHFATGKNQRLSRNRFGLQLSKNHSVQGYSSNYFWVKIKINNPIITSRMINSWLPFTFYDKMHFWWMFYENFGETGSISPAKIVHFGIFSIKSRLASAGLDSKISNRVRSFDSEQPGIPPLCSSRWFLKLHFGYPPGQKL